METTFMQLLKYDQKPTFKTIMYNVESKHGHPNS